MAEFVLYSYFRSSASYRARLALNVKGIKYEYRAVHLLNNGGEQHRTEYRELNPSQQVPTLIHNRNVIGQTVAIFEYLEEIKPTPALYPHTAAARAKVRQFCEIINCTQPLQNLATLQFLESQFRATEGQKKVWMTEWMGRGYEAAEKMLQKNAGTYCFGDQLTAADCFLVPQVFASNRFKIELNQYPTLKRIHTNLEKLESFKKAHPHAQPDTPPEFRA